MVKKYSQKEIRRIAIARKVKKTQQEKDAEALAVYDAHNEKKASNSKASKPVVLTQEDLENGR